MKSILSRFEAPDTSLSDHLTALMEYQPPTEEKRDARKEVNGFDYTHGWDEADCKFIHKTTKEGFKRIKCLRSSHHKEFYMSDEMRKAREDFVNIIPRFVIHSFYEDFCRDAGIVAGNVFIGGMYHNKNGGEPKILEGFNIYIDCDFYGDFILPEYSDFYCRHHGYVEL